MAALIRLCESFNVRVTGRAEGKRIRSRTAMASLETANNAPMRRYSPRLRVTAATATQGASSFEPAVASVWNTVASPDSPAGCAAALSIVPYGPGLITPGGDRLVWHNTAQEDYTFSRVQANVFQYAGATPAGDGTVNMTLTFTAGQTLEMVRVFSPSAEPGCTHTHFYTGVWQFDR